MRRAAAAAAFVLALVALGACGGDPATSPLHRSTTAPAERYEDATGRPAVTVEVFANQFQPQFVTVSPGTEVTFVAGSNHDVVPAKPGAFEAITQADFTSDSHQTVTFSEPGLHRYYCSLHGTVSAGMHGAVKVAER